MLARTQVKALPIVTKAVEYVPATQACCGACRTCATTNVLTLLGAGLVAVASQLRRVVRRTEG